MRNGAVSDDLREMLPLALSSELLGHLANEDLSLSPLDLDEAMVSARAVAFNRSTWLRAPKTSLRPAIEVVACKSYRFGAQAVGLAPHAYGIVIYDQSVRALRDTYHRALSHAECFVGVGEPELETIRKPTVENLSANDADMDDYVRPAPRCPVRAAYAELLTQVGVTCLAMHELGHIAQGQLRLKQLEPDLSPEQIYSLEWGADTFATMTMVDWGLLCLRQGRMPTVVKTEGDVLRLLTRATHLLQMHDERSATSRHPTDGSSHPVPRRRQVCSAYCLAATYKLVTKTEAPPQTADMMECEVAYTAITGRKPDKEWVFECFTSPDYNAAHERWQVELRPKLAPLAYVGLHTAGPSPNTFHTTVPRAPGQPCPCGSGQLFAQCHGLAE